MYLMTQIQFGGQEPGDSKAITYFAEKQSFDGIILGKKDVNGPNTRPIFTYLKNVTGKQRINWSVSFYCPHPHSIFL